jgi:hypothetical protein
MPAPIGGTFLAPGVSKNGRLYTSEAIAGAVERMKARIADPNSLPITMRTHHAAGDDSTKIVAYVTGVNLETDGSATWEASPVDTTAGRDIMAATRPGPDGKRALAAVSIRGWWNDPVRRVTHEGRMVDTASDLEIDGIDFTATPGVDQARITAYQESFTSESTARTVLTESVEASVDTVIDEASITVSAMDDDYDTSVTVSSYTSADDPLGATATKAGAAAQAALDVINASDDEEDGEMCTSCAAPMPPGANFCPSCGAASGVDDQSAPDNTMKEHTMSDSKVKTEESGGDPTLEETDGSTTASSDDGATSSAPGAGGTGTIAPAVTTESVPATEQKAEESTSINEAFITEAVNARVNEAVAAMTTKLGDAMGAKLAEAVDSMRDEVLRAYGTPKRTGLKTAESLSAEPAKPLHQMDSAEFNSYAGKIWEPVLGAGA